jgi:hypothetical protein
MGIKSQLIGIEMAVSSVELMQRRAFNLT